MEEFSSCLNSCNNLIKVAQSEPFYKKGAHFTNLIGSKYLERSKVLE